MMEEEWRTLPTLSRYKFSSLGRIWSIPKDRILQITATTRFGYLMVRLFRDGETKATSFMLHKLIALAFHGAPRPGEQVHHISHIKKDNSSSNLTYVTQSENIRASFATGTRRKCLNPRDYNLTTEQHKRIRRLHKQGLSQCAIATRIGCTNSTISRFLNGRA